MKAAPPFLLHPFPEWEGRVRAGFTLRYADGPPSPAAAPLPAGSGYGAYADLNLGFRSGDDPARVTRNWIEVMSAMGLAGRTLALPRMVHGDNMADVDALPDPEDRGPDDGASGDGASDNRALVRLEPENADAVCTSASRRVLAVTMADCLTALVFDPASGTAAAVHAGWRGTRARILGKALRSLADQGRLRPESTWVAFGPCLRKESLEVGGEIAATLDARFVTERAGRFWFDMPGDNRDQALECGIAPDHVRDLGGSTLREPERYFSYRRDGPASGRLAACISIL